MVDGKSYGHQLALLVDGQEQPESLRVVQVHLVQLSEALLGIILGKLAHGGRNNPLLRQQPNKGFINNNSVAGRGFTRGGRSRIAVCLRACGAVRACDAVFVVVSVVIFVVPYIGTCGFLTFKCAVS